MGSDEVLDLIFRSFCEPKQRDYYLRYHQTFTGCIMSWQALIMLRIKENSILTLDLNLDVVPPKKFFLKKADAHSKILFLCSS